MSDPATSIATPGYPDEAALLAGLRAKDPEAFAALVRAYGGRMLAVARRFLRQEQDARDAVQDAFISAFRGLDGFSGSSRLSTWLHRIVVNAALMRIRSRKRHREDSIEELLPTFTADGHQANPAVEWTATAHDAVVSAERKALVRRAIDELPDTYRTVLMMRDIDEMDTAEAATSLGISQNAVKVRLHRARQALRTLLDPHLRRGDL